MCGRIELASIRERDERVEQVLERLRMTHSNGGAFLAVVSVGTDGVFNWFASRNRLLENEILPLLMR